MRPWKCVIESQGLSRHLLGFCEGLLRRAISPHRQRYVGLCLCRVGQGEVGINLKSAIKMGDGTVQSLFAALFPEKPPSQIFSISFGIYLWDICGFGLVLPRELRLHGVGDCLCDFSLHCESVTNIPLIGLCPQMAVCRSINQLGRDGNAIICTLYATFHHSVHIQVARDLRDGFSGLLILHC